MGAGRARLVSADRLKPGTAPPPTQVHWAGRRSERTIDPDGTIGTGRGETLQLASEVRRWAATMILDQVMPDPEHSVAAHAVIEADAATTWRAVHEANLFDNRTVRWLIGLRDLPSFAWERIRGRPAELAPPAITFDEVVRLEGWVLLGEEPERELVAGSIGRFWQRDYGWTDVPAAEFAGFDEPGLAKTIAGLSIRSYGDRRTLLTYESRTSTTSADARRKFGRYWFVLRPFVGLVMRQAVSAIRSEAERERALVER